MPLLAMIETMPLGRILRECWIATNQFSPCLPVLRRRLKLSRRYPCDLSTRSGLAFTAETYHDLVTAWIIFCRAEYSPDAKSQLIVDLGANVGLFTLWAAQQCPQATVWAVEPFPQCAARLSEHIDRNGLSDRVRVVNKAVARSSGSRVMNATGPTQSNGLQPLGTEASAHMVSVDAVSLQELLTSILQASGKTMIDFLKIDVEGGEHEFLRAGEVDVLQHVRAIGIEYHPNGLKAALFAVLKDQGFKLMSDVVAHENSGVAHFKRLESSQEAV